jgi:hypothetical protein
MAYPTRRAFLADMARFTAALPLIDWSGAMAQQRVPRIGFMSGAEPSLISSFEDEMRKLGYSPGKNIHIEIRVGRLYTSDTAAHAAELGVMDLDFVVVAALPQALAMRQANRKMPMVIITCPGMVSNGFAESLERPGGIYTGMDELPPGVTRKRLQLLKRAAPSVSRVALFDHAGTRRSRDATRGRRASRARSEFQCEGVSRQFDQRDHRGPRCDPKRSDGWVGEFPGRSFIGQPANDYRFRRGSPAAGCLSVSVLCRVGRTHGVGAGSARSIPFGCSLCGSDSQREEAGRYPGATSRAVSIASE